MQLEVQNISVSLGKEKTPILHEVSFTAPDGCFVSLLGPSGAGKSTLLKILAGTLVQDAGSVLVNGQSIDELPPHKRQLGFVYQDIRLFPHMTVAENVEFGLKMQSLAKDERAQRARAMLERVHMGGMEKRYPRELSGGQAQRVALARTLACNPQVLLLDEPFSGLDELLRDDMRSLVLGLHRELGITTIMVTHDAIEALELSDHIVYLDEGRVLQQGTPHELFETPASPQVAASFGDSSTITGEVTDGVFHCADLHIELAALNTCTIPQGYSGPATAVVRFGAVSLGQASCNSQQSDLLELGELPIRCGVYRGQECLTRFELDGQVLTVPTQEQLPAGTRHKVYAKPQGVFVFA